MPRRIAPQPQLGMDEKVVEDADLEKILEARLRAADDRNEAAGVFKTHDVDAKEKIAALELEDGDVIRVGRFRIKKTVSQPRHVEFDAASAPRISIRLVE